MNEYETEYLGFWKEGVSESGKTEIWSVFKNDGETILGTIKWFGRWRQYAFFPGDDTVYNDSCLDEIRKALQTLNKEKRGGA